METFKKCTENPLSIAHQHPMYLDFGDCCLKRIIPEWKKNNENKIKLITVVGCWNTEDEMGKENNAIYQKIVNDILSYNSEQEKETKGALKHIHFYRDLDQEVPYFIKIHRASAHGGDYNTWFSKPGPWFDQIKQSK